MTIEHTCGPCEGCQRRLDMQAAAIRDLRTRLADLETALDIAEADLPVSDDPIPTRRPGVFVPRPECMGCGETKHPSRFRYLTCRDCGIERQANIKSRSLPVVAACMNCGTPKSGTALLCTLCSKGFKVWKASL